MAAPLDLSGKVALVTGAGRGIGLATARHLALAGAHVVLGGRDPDVCESAAAALTDEALSASAIALDVADYGSAASAAAGIAARHGRLDILVNNAGSIGPLAPIATADPAEWAGAIRTNLVGPFNICRAVAELMPAGAVIVNIGSSAADGPVEAMSAYCASKAGLELFTRCLAAEYAGRGIRVIGFRPGRVDTGMHALLREARANRLAEVDRATLSPVERPAAAIVALCAEQSHIHHGRIVDLTELVPAPGNA